MSRLERRSRALVPSRVNPHPPLCPPTGHGYNREVSHMNGFRQISDDREGALTVLRVAHAYAKVPMRFLVWLHFYRPAFVSNAVLQKVYSILDAESEASKLRA